jgi:hypothetical protein
MLDDELNKFLTRSESMHPLNEDNLNEILDAFLNAEMLPSPTLMVALGNAAGKTSDVIKQQYTMRYQAANDTTEDPFDLP